MYITENDVYNYIRAGLVNELTDNPEGLISSAIKSAIAEIQLRLDNCDITTELKKFGNARNAALVAAGSEIAVYHLTALVRSDIDIETRVQRYNKAIDILTTINENTSLFRKKEEETPIKWRSIATKNWEF